MKKILIIEDEKILGEMYRHKFIRSGFEVIWAEGAKEGMELAKKEKPDLILLDILLPKENGIFFLQKMKKDSAVNSIPVVVFSNFDDPETKKTAKSLGVKNYLIKTNYTPQEIVEKVKGYLSSEN